MIENLYNRVVAVLEAMPYEHSTHGFALTKDDPEATEEERAGPPLMLEGIQIEPEDFELIDGEAAMFFGQAMLYLAVDWSERGSHMTIQKHEGRCIITKIGCSRSLARPLIWVSAPTFDEAALMALEAALGLPVTGNHQIWKE